MGSSGTNNTNDNNDNNASHNNAPKKKPTRHNTHNNTHDDGNGTATHTNDDVRQAEVVTPKRSMKWLEDEILTMRKSTPSEGLAGQLDGAACTCASSKRELDYLSLLSALRATLADVERRLEKLEIKDME